jgi:hypothetical protein
VPGESNSSGVEAHISQPLYRHACLDLSRISLLNARETAGMLELSVGRTCDTASSHCRPTKQHLQSRSHAGLSVSFWSPEIGQVNVLELLTRIRMEWQSKPMQRRVICTEHVLETIGRDSLIFGIRCQVDSSSAARTIFSGSPRPTHSCHSA